METLNYRSMVKVIQRSRSVHMLSHSNTPLYQNLVFQCQRAKTIFPDSNSWWKYNFDIDVKGQGHRGYECTWHLILWWYTHMPNIVPLCQRTKSCGPNTKPWGQWSTSYLRNTFFYGNRPMCVPYMVSQCQIKKQLWARHENTSKTLLIGPWGQRATSYWDHECTWHTVSLWYTHVLNMVSQRQTKIKL